jgi:PKD repeat protein
MKGCNFNTYKDSFSLYFLRILTIFLFSVTSHSFCQISIPGTPESFRFSQKKNIVLPKKSLRNIDIDSLLKEDHDMGISNRYGVVQDLNINLRDSSVKTEIPGKGYIWQYELGTEKAFSLGILFNSFHLPAGASVFIYTPDHNQVLGAFTGINNNPLTMLAIAELKDHTAIIEYFEPYIPEFPGEIVLGSVSLAYRDIIGIIAAEGRVGINCPQGENWQDDKHAVCRMTFRDVGGAYYCTGFMVNNAREDLTPYFMTANHCISTTYSASTLTAYFNYENSGCNTTDASAVQVLSGSTLIANNAYSDFTLLLLNNVPPKNYRPFLAGWDASGRIPMSGVGIHHPSGTPKCISTDNAPLVLYDGEILWENNIVTKPYTHWEAKFSSGTTEVGSSGSPVFDDNHRIVGQLHGRDNATSLYGAFHVSWNHNENNSTQLRHWLDPDNSGILAMEGRYIYAMPLAEFSAIDTLVCLDNTINLSDNSKYEPNSWKWDISPASFQFMNGTTNTSRNPEVKFTEVGNYSVKLVSTNQYGSDSLVKTDYLKVTDEIEVTLQGVPADNYICGCDLNNFPISAAGANNYRFSFNRPEKAEMIVSSNIAYLSLLEDQQKYGSFNSVLRVEGSVGTCKNSDSINLNIVMQRNDDIQNAVYIFPGKNGPFSNTCATGQVNEPYPSALNCYSNIYWCPGTTSKGIQNSVWFIFAGPENRKITISTKGINDRIAVYEADSWQQVLSGRPINYNILAANDDRSSVDANALLENLYLLPEKNYWLQVESLEKDTGNVTISLITKSFELFPNPCNGLFDVIISSSSDGLASIYIYSSTGKIILSERLEILADENRFSFDLSSNPSGLYYFQTRIAGKVFSGKIMLLH